ncbi:MAG: DUF559 domain-containing protein [Solirubrobacteraceae bacterium]|nr:DUF559 domain-containing protein [Patulibacter sp.]
MDDIPKTPTGRTPRAVVNAEIAKRLREQQGQISYRQLVAAGLSDEAVARRVKTRQLILQTEAQSQRRRARPRARPRSKPHRVYSAHGGPLSPDARRWAAVLSAPEPAYLSHLSACALHGLDIPPRTPIHVVHVGGGWEPPRGVVAHRTTHLPNHDIATNARVPATTLSRGLLDAAVSSRAELLDDLLDSAVRLGIYDGASMVRVLNERPTTRGVAPLTAAIGRLDSTSGTFRSNFERRTTRLVERSRRIPAPVVNVLVEGYEPDLWWRGTRAIVECDGRDYHRSPAQIAKDEEREAILRALGFRFLRLRWHHVVYEEERTLERIERFVLANMEAPVAGR